MNTKITIEINGQTFVADSSAGTGRCSTCAIRGIASVGKQCRWSLVCGFHLSGANFKRIKTPETKDGVNEYYDKHSYSGD